MTSPALTDEQFSLVRSIIHKCPALKLPQTLLQKLGMTAQIVPLIGLTDEQAQAIVDRLNAAPHGVSATDEARELTVRYARLGTHVENFAITLGWKREDGEGAFEFIQRKSYRQGWEDGKQEASGDIHRDSTHGVKTVDPTDPGYDVDVLRDHVRHLERRIRDLHAERNAGVKTVPVSGPLRDLGAYLARVLDEDQFAHAEWLLLKAAPGVDLPDGAKTCKS